MQQSFSTTTINPATGEDLMPVPKRVVTFKCSGKLRDPCFIRFAQIVQDRRSKHWPGHICRPRPALPEPDPRPVHQGGIPLLWSDQGTPSFQLYFIDYPEWSNLLMAWYVLIL